MSISFVINRLMLRKRHLKNVGLFVFLLFSLHCSARIFVVTDTNDTISAHSLRGAILEANRRGGQNTIILGGAHSLRQRSVLWIYHLTIPGADEGAGLTGDLNITRGDLTITSPEIAEIDATHLGDRIFNVSPRARLTLQNLYIIGGNAAGNNYGTNADGESGGAIYNEGELSLVNCTLINSSSGNAQNPNLMFLTPGNGGNGGSIYNSGLLSMSKCTVAGNRCGMGSDSAWSGVGGTGGNGGAIYNAGQMNLSQCNISDNLSGWGAGATSEPIAIYDNGGTIEINVFGIVGVAGGNGGDGGGIYNAGQCNINFSTVGDNICGFGGFGSGGNGGGLGAMGGNGGGIYNSGKLDFNTCTISGNFCGNGGIGGFGDYGGNGTNGGAGGNGGGIYNGGVFTSTSSTIAFNLTGAGGVGGNSSPFNLGTFPPPGIGGQGGSGGGVFNDAEAANVVLRNTLIASNAANVGGVGGTDVILTNDVATSGPDGTGFDLAGGFTSGGYNLVSTGDGSTGLINGVNADQVGSDANPIDPMLGPLQFNGGPTPTHALLWGSPAIDRGYSFGVQKDQRGSQRPYIYFSGFSGDGSDIGAFELNPN
jgi:hypothetical protein